ncbi:MAG TPA: fibrillarin-like rRNA/tRNA 2'-O-methyltransferase [Thermoplasmata archaeon]|nr:fibrillarin-like rRNA/tRNA 2'-O-methyltransferase [Thermoplasmata archaeon]
MREESRPRRSSVPSRLHRLRRGDRTELWTEAVGSLPPVYGERWKEVGGLLCRSFDPSRSKLAAAIAHDWSGDLPRIGERWLYLGAASGTTASHVADLVGPSGRVYAVEKSLRPFARLYQLSERWPNLLPVLADARTPEDYADLVPPVEGLYADIAQPDQIEIVRRNAALYLRAEGRPVLIALKTASIGRNRPPAAFLALAEKALDPVVELESSVRLDPFHRAHYFVGGRVRRTLFPAEAGSPVSSTPARRPGARRR